MDLKQQAFLFFWHCNELAQQHYDLGIRPLYFHDGQMVIRIGERFGRPQWEEVRIPISRVTWPPSEIPAYTELERYTYYAHNYGLELHRRTYGNFKSAMHMVRFCIRKWDEVKHLRTIDDGGLF